MAAWNNGQVMEPGVYVNEPAPKTTKKKGSAQSGALSVSMDDLLEALTGQRQGMVSEQAMPKQTAATKEPKETALKMPGLSSELGGLAGALVGARNSRAQRYQQSDPWSIGAEVVNDPGLADGLGMKLDKPWKQGLMKIAQGLIGGYLGGKARQGLEEYDRPFMQAIKQAGSTGDFSGIPISSQDDPTGTLQMSLALSGMEDKKKRNDDLNKELIKNGMMIQPDGSFGQVPGYAEMRGKIKDAEEGRTGLGMAGALVGAQQMEKSPYEFGTDAKPYDQKWQEYYRTNVQLGMTPNEAAKQSSARVIDEKKLMGSAATDAQELRERAKKLRQVTEVAQRAIDGDPYTGTGAGLYNTVSQLWGGGDPNYGLLGSLESQLNSAYRVVGTGSSSDKDFASILKSGPSTSKPKVENQAIIDKIERLVNEDMSYADYLDNYVANVGTVQGAQQAWEKYRAENNPLDDKPDTPWQDFFKRKQPAQSSGMDYGLPAGLAPETQNYVPKVLNGAQQLDMETLLDRVRAVESSNGKNLLSPKGAKGPYQLMDATGLELMQKAGLDPRTYDPFNEQQSRMLAKIYLSELTQRYNGDQRLALAAYNTGMGNLDKAIGRTRGGQQQAPAQMASNAPSGLPQGARPLGKTPPKARKPGTQVVRDDATGDYYEVPA